MKFELTETTRVYKHPGTKPTGEWVETCKHVAYRSEEQVDDSFHDMKLGEIREVTKSSGYHITRIE